jgi:predicted esterase
MLVTFAEPQRIRRLPITIVHGELDRMYPVSMVIEASETLHRAGACARGHDDA